MNYNINYSEKITKVALKWVKLNFNLDDFFHFFEFFYIYTSVKSIYFFGTFIFGSGVTGVLINIFLLAGKWTFSTKISTNDTIFIL